ncbi:transcriptional repressor [Cohnella sp. CBP 2801]|uniref:Transcriptional repressor n=2 Tax=Cohnella zeiphila TaxID=2761120 RepID=A0A7X0SLL2_9BACL|nr:transcriptional repressor [Cohnella zeiphila]
MESMLNRMSEAGLRITEQRKKMAKLFAESPGFVSAGEIFLYLRSFYSGLSYDTVYRNLRLLLKLELVELVHFEDGNKFRINRDEKPSHHHHFICLACDYVMPIEYCPMASLPALPDSVTVIKHRFDVYGYCGNCGKNRKPEVTYSA